MGLLVKVVILASIQLSQHGSYLDPGVSLAWAEGEEEVGSCLTCTKSQCRHTTIKGAGTLQLKDTLQL